MKTSILSIAYFAPIQWYHKLTHSDICIIDQYEYFIKQTYRNRCNIFTANGVQSLSIPIEKNKAGKTIVKDIRISSHGNWRHQHWNALVSAYSESPFFEYYEDDIRPFFEKDWAFLFDFNFEITYMLCNLLGIEPKIILSDKYIESSNIDINTIDYRNTITPKSNFIDATFVPQKYYQVFRQKFPFISNLSILDLLFNMGNEAILYL